MGINQFSAAEKKRQAYSLAIRGSTVQTVAQIMGVTVPTVRGWIDSYKSEIQGTISQINREDYATLFMDRMDQIRQEAWTHYTSARKEADKRSWLKVALEVELKEKDGLIDLGLLNRNPTQHEHTHVARLGVGAGEIRPEQLDALAAIALSGSMGLEPHQVLAMCGRPSAPVPVSKGHIPVDNEWNKGGNRIEDADVIPHDPVCDVPLSDKKEVS